MLTSVADRFYPAISLPVSSCFNYVNSVRIIQYIYYFWRFSKITEKLNLIHNTV